MSAEAVGQLAFDILSPTQREAFKAHLEIDLSIALKGLGRFRVNIFKQRQQVGIALRVIPNTVPTLEDLSLPPILAKLAHEERGLILLTGVTGSGKSTTLAAMVQEINTTCAKHIITIEDPIEFSFQDRLSLISQREIGVDSHSFSNALRAALRQDPDVILVSEIRDRATMEIALSAAETGHLVFASLHALNAPEAITRVVDFFETHHSQAIRHLLAGTLKAIISQRLVPKESGGRVAALEVMVNRGAVSECIEHSSRTKEIPDFLMGGTAQYGTQSFDQALFWLQQRGEISKENALRYATQPEDLEMRFAGIAGDDWQDPTQ
jgi:twitching motility protein PilT